MSESANAVHGPPSSARLLERAARSVPCRPMGPERLSSTVLKVAWIPRRDLGHSEWLATGRRLGTIGRCSQWWIGDWIRYGTSRWGEKYAAAARVTGYDVASLRNMAWVASRFDLSLRSDKLTWSHHVLLAPLEPDEQRHWLNRASEERLSVADLRVELRTLRNGDRKSHPVGDVPASANDDAASANDDAGVIVCPRCGHRMHPSQG